MELEGEPLPVTNLEVAVSRWNELVGRVQSGVHEVADGVRIACAEAVLDNETGSGTSHLWSSLQLGLGHAVHRDADVALEEALVAECGNCFQDVLVGVGTEVDGTSGHASERTLVLRPVGLRIDLLGEVLAQSEVELALYECQQVECGIVDGSVRNANTQTYAVGCRSDVGEVQVLLAQGLDLTLLLHLHVVNAYGPNLVAGNAGHDVHALGQTQTLVESWDDVVDGQLDSTRSLDVVGLGVQSDGVQGDGTSALGLAALHHLLTDVSSDVALAVRLLSLLVSYFEVDAAHFALAVLNLTAEVGHLHLLLVCQFTVGGLHVDVAQFLVGSKTLLAELFKCFLHLEKRFCW